MRIFLIVLLTVSGIYLILIIGYVIYENNASLRAYKRQIFGLRSDYLKLKSEYEEYKSKNTRQISITSNDNNSTHAHVGEIINTYSNTVNGDISVYFKNLATSESVVVDEDRKYYMASLYKIILTLYILEQIKDNKVSLSSRVGTSSATINFALNKIITESNNEYAQFLAGHYGWFKIEDVMKQKLGIDFSFNQKLETNIKNIGALLENVALALKVTDSESNYLLNLMKDQKKTSKLPKYLPENIYSHNKTGEFEGYSHDAGIFYTPKANYILIFMSKTKNPGATNEHMALMSRDIYQTLNESSQSPVSKNTKNQ